mmetsp:Transcript_62963/g.181124  ORF Transcript_62963/g.181124 Transcript_62963/m.181124 type:complete len:209 (+) Transcript_62963:668-1294(+)
MAKCSRNCSSSACSKMLLFGGEVPGEASLREAVGPPEAPRCFSATSRRKCSSSSTCTSCAICNSWTVRSSMRERSACSSKLSRARAAHSLSSSCSSARCLASSSASVKVPLVGVSVVLRTGEADRTGEVPGQFGFASASTSAACRLRLSMRISVSNRFTSSSHWEISSMFELVTPCISSMRIAACRSCSTCDSVVYLDPPGEEAIIEL